MTLTRLTKRSLYCSTARRMRIYREWRAILGFSVGACSQPPEAARLSDLCYYSYGIPVFSDFALGCRFSAFLQSSRAARSRERRRERGRVGCKRSLSRLIKNMRFHCLPQVRKKKRFRVSMKSELWTFETIQVRCLRRLPAANASRRHTWGDGRGGKRVSPTRGRKHLHPV